MSTALTLSPLASPAYPQSWQKRVVIADQTMTLRFVRPEDAYLLPDYFGSFTDEELFLRFFIHMPRDKLCRQRAVALYTDAFDDTWSRIFVLVDAHGSLQGVCRAMEYRDKQHGGGTGHFEISFSVRMKHKGIGTLLMRELLAWARTTLEVCQLGAMMNSRNTGMGRLFENFAFERTAESDVTTTCFALEIR